MFSNILIYFVIIPLLMLGGFFLCRDIKQIRAVAVTGSTLLVALSVWLLVDYLALRAAGEQAEMLFTDSWTWFGPLNINLAVGVDGVSIAMLILSSIIVFAGSFASWKIDDARHFFMWLLLLSTGVFGFFITVDLFTMFMFYEVALIPMYLLIGVWGTGRKEYSAMKLTLMLMGGSASSAYIIIRHLKVASLHGIFLKSPRMPRFRQGGSISSSPCVSWVSVCSVPCSPSTPGAPTVMPAPRLRCRCFMRVCL